MTTQETLRNANVGMSTGAGGGPSGPSGFLAAGAGHSGSAPSSESFIYSYA